MRPSGPVGEEKELAVIGWLFDCLQRNALPGEQFAEAMDRMGMEKVVAAAGMRGKTAPQRPRARGRLSRVGLRPLRPGRLSPVAAPVPAFGDDPPRLPDPLLQPCNPCGSAEALLDLEELPCFLLVEGAITPDAVVAENLDPVLQL